MLLHLFSFLLRLVGVLFLVVSFNGFPASDLPKVSYQFYSVEQPVVARQSSIYHIVSDQDDLIWLATDTDGLVRYDGYHYQAWTKVMLDGFRQANISKLYLDEGVIWSGTWGMGLVRWESETQTKTNYRFEKDRPSISNDHVQTLFKDNANRLWVGTLSGLNYINLTEPDLVHHLPPENPLSTLRIWWMQESNNALWVATSVGLYKLSKDLSSWQVYTLDGKADELSRLNEIRTIELIQDELWVGTDSGLFVFDQVSTNFKAIDFGNNPALKSTIRINDIQPDASTNTVLVGTNNGIYRFHADTYSLVFNGEKTSDILGTDIRSLAVDKTGNIWVGTRNKGLYRGIRIERRFTQLLQYTDIPSALNGNVPVKSAYYSDASQLWLATKEGIYRRPDSLQENSWQFLPFPNNYKTDEIGVLFVDSNNHLWVGASDKVFRSPVSDEMVLKEYTGFSALALKDVRLTSIYQDNSSEIYFGIWGVGVAQLSSDEKQLVWVDKSISNIRSNMAYSIFKLGNDNLYAATRFSGVIPLKASAPLQATVSSAQLYCAHVDINNTLWLCSDDGLWRVDTDTGSTVQYGIEDGLPSKRILDITHDNSGMVWVATHLGLVSIDPNDDKIRRVGLAHGLPIETFTERGITRSFTGMITLASSEGAFEFNPSYMFTDESPSYVRLTEISFGYDKDQQEVSSTKSHFKLLHDHAPITLQFTVTDFRESSKNMFRYRLVGRDKKWTDWHLDRELVLSNLPLGETLLEVEGRNSLGAVTAAPLKLHFFITTPWWMNKGILLFLLFALLAILWLIIRWRTRQLAKVAAKLEFDVQERTKQLEEANLTLSRLAETDPLTGLTNRRGFAKAFNLTQRLRERSCDSMSVLLVDVDYFKKFNDTYGHEAGDDCLKLIADTALKVLRSQDTVARWGGEEFTVLLPNTGQQGAYTLAQKLRIAVQDAVSKQFNVQAYATLTIGVVSNLALDAPLEEWLRRADNALYKGKATGRNQVVIADSD